VIDVIWNWVLIDWHWVIILLVVISLLAVILGAGGALDWLGDLWW
jgi:hypothetical protein